MQLSADGLTCTVLCLLTFAVGVVAEPVETRTFLAEGGRFEFSNGVLSITVEQGAAPSTTIIYGETGELVIDGQEILTDKKGRKDLKKFYHETVKMADLLDKVGADVAAQMDSSTSPKEAEKLAKNILRTGDKLEKQSAKVAAIAAKLMERIPELESLLTFLGDENEES